MQTLYRLACKNLSGINESLETLETRLFKISLSFVFSLANGQEKKIRKKMSQSRGKLPCLLFSGCESCRAAERDRRDVMGIGVPRACTRLLFLRDRVFPPRCGFALRGRRQELVVQWCCTYSVRTWRAYTTFLAQKVRIWRDVGKDTLNIWPFALSRFRRTRK